MNRTTNRRRLEAARLLRSFLAALDSRQSTRTEDAPTPLLETLVRSETGHEDIVGAAMAMLVSGATLSVRGLLAWICYAVENQLPADLWTNNRLIEIALGQWPIAATVDRVAAEPVKVGPFNIERERRVRVPLTSGISGDDQLPVLPFGLGAHYCLGAAWVRLLCRCGCSALLAGHELEIIEVHGPESDLPFSGIERLEVRLKEKSWT